MKALALLTVYVVRYRVNFIYQINCIIKVGNKYLVSMIDMLYFGFYRF